MPPAPIIFDRVLLRRRRARSLSNPGRPTFLDEAIFSELRDRLTAVNRVFRTIVLHGAAVPKSGDSLRKIYPDAEVLETDAVETASTKLVFDDEALPFAGSSIDAFLHASGLESVNDVPGVLGRIRNVLKPDGLFLGAALGGRSLAELRAAWLSADSELPQGASPRIAPFIDIRQWGALLQHAGFALPVVDRDRLTVRYDDALALMADLRGLGFANALHDRSRRPVTRSLLQKVLEQYGAANSGPDGRVQAGFEIIYLTGWSSHESQQQPLKPGSARLRLSDALNVKEQKLKRD